MAPKFKVKVLNTSKLLKNTAIISVVILSFFLIFFSKSDYILINGIKNISSSFISPVTRIISSPLNIISNLRYEYNQFKNLKFVNLLSSTQFSSTIDFCFGICSMDFLLAPKIN